MCSDQKGDSAWVANSSKGWGHVVAAVLLSSKADWPARPGTGTATFLSSADGGRERCAAPLALDGGKRRHHGWTPSLGDMQSGRRKHRSRIVKFEVNCASVLCCTAAFPEGILAALCQAREGDHGSITPPTSRRCCGPLRPAPCATIAYCFFVPRQGPREKSLLQTASRLSEKSAQHEELTAASRTVGQQVRD